MPLLRRSDGDPVAGEPPVRWTVDERIDDAFPPARSIALVQQVLVDPGRWLGPPEGEPACRADGGGADRGPAAEVAVPAGAGG